MSHALLMIAAALYLGGTFLVFRSQRRRGRLPGLTLLAGGGLLLLLLAGPAPGSAVPVAAISGLTLIGLLAVATALERTAHREDGSDLRLDTDPLRWR